MNDTSQRPRRVQRARHRRPPRRRTARALLPALLLVPLPALLLVLPACQGDFERPAFDNPNDPTLGVLPLSPEISAVHALDCDAGGPRMEIDWTIDSENGIAEYQVYRAAAAGVDPGDLILHVPAGTQQVIDAGPLVENTTYYYRVRAIDGAGGMSLRSAVASERSRTCE